MLFNLIERRRGLKQVIATDNLSVLTCRLKSLREANHGTRVSFVIRPADGAYRCHSKEK